MLGLLKIFAAFAAIIFMVRKKVLLGTAMVLGAILLALLAAAGWYFFGSGNLITPFGFLSIVRNALWDTSSQDPSSILKLVGVIVLVLILSHCLQKTGQMNRILRSFQNLVGDARVVLSTLPALIGLLPMPGGAIFSAPMVQDAQKDIDLPPAKKTLINYWFRHVWEYSWPLYPGLLLAAQLSGKSVFRLAAVQFPMTAAAILGGIIFVLRKVPGKPAQSTPKEQEGSLAALAADISPILTIIGTIALLHLAARMKPNDSLLLALLVSIVLTLAASFLKNRALATAVLKSLPAADILKLAYVIIGLMIFRGTIENSGAVAEISDMMKTYHVPLFPFIVLLSFICGLVTGLTMAYVGIVFPVLTPLILQVAPDPLPYLVLAFGCGFIGVLFSPVHVCLILSHQYFRSDLSTVYRGMLRPVLVVLATLIGLFLILLRLPLRSA